MWISQLEVCQEGGVKKGGTWRTLGGFLTRDLEDRVIMVTMEDLRGPQGSYPESFVSLSLFLADIYKLVRSRANICRSDSVTQSVSQLVRIADTELDSPESS